MSAILHAKEVLVQLIGLLLCMLREGKMRKILNAVILLDYYENVLANFLCRYWCYDMKSGFNKYYVRTRSIEM
ncbi:hypothetical protein GGR08_000978 [Bartonella fuyuanensis]|uniref:Uncharacterized protein n=1 Tax=Bartonella fuyuanensis TaxID=1460968 RepID=A0A840DYS7_9HYPH|nr:hypothetical protein [Bartonella fuyuanensis]